MMFDTKVTIGPVSVGAVTVKLCDLRSTRLSCIADDAQGEQIEVLWDAEM